MITKIKLIIKKIIYFFKLIIGFQLFLLIFIFSKYKLIRFYYLRAHRIGHLVEDYYLYKQIKKKKSIDIFYLPTGGNSFLVNYVKRNNIVFPRIIVEPIYLFIILIYSRFHFFRKHLAYCKYNKKSNYQHFKNKKFLKFSKIEKNLGEKYLLKINPKKKKIACININSLEHLSIFKKGDWIRQNFRKSKIEDYEIIIKFLIKKNYLVVRMGHANKPIINNDLSKNFIDYAYTDRNDFLDVYLMSKCSLYISNCTGLDYLAFAFNVPMFINTPTIQDFFIERDNVMYLMKQYQDIITKKNFNLEQIYSKKIIYTRDTNFFKEKKIKIIPNTKKQLLDGIKDMMEILNNVKKIKKEFQLKNDKFWNLYKKNLNTSWRKKYYLKRNINSFYSWSNINF